MDLLTLTMLAIGAGLPVALLPLGRFAPGWGAEQARGRPERAA